MGDSRSLREDRQTAEPGAFATSGGDQHRPGGEESFPGAFNMHTETNASVGHFGFPIGAAPGYPSSQPSDIQESSQTQVMRHNPPGSDETNYPSGQPFIPNAQDAQNAVYLESLLRDFLQQAPPPPPLPDLDAYFSQFSHNITETIVTMFEALGERFIPPLPNPNLPSSDEVMSAPDSGISTTAGTAVPIPSAPSTATPEPSAPPPAAAGLSFPPAPTSPVALGTRRCKLSNERVALLVSYFHCIPFLPSLTTIAGYDSCCYEGIRL